MIKDRRSQNSKFLSLVIFISLACLVDRSLCYCTYKFISNINFLGQGYNIFKGNPYTTQGNDPGFTNFNLIDFKYPLDEIQNFSSQFNPIGVQGNSVHGCSQYYEYIDSLKQYRDKLSERVYPEDQLLYSPFSASVDYQRIRKGLTEDKVYFMTFNSCSETSVRLLPEAQENIEFLDMMKELLEAGDEESAYHDIFDLIGTHVSSEVTLGQRFGQYFELDSQFVKNNKEFKQIISVIDRLASIPSNQFSEVINQNDIFMNWTSYSQGSHPLSPNKNDNNQPVQINLISLQQFIKEYGKNVEQKDIIIQRMDKYYKSYCKVLLTQLNRDVAACNIDDNAMANI